MSHLLKNQKLDASGTSGLGSVFVAVADKYMRKGGTLGLVLPKTLLSGVSWQKTHKLIGNRYVLKTLISSQDPRRKPHKHTKGHWNFSDNTDLSEVLVIAKKIEDPSTYSDDSSVLCVNLWRNPVNSWEALGVARSLMKGEPPKLRDGQGALQIAVGDTKFGEAVSVSWKSIKDTSWILPCAFAQAELARATLHLVEGDVYIPGKGVVSAVPVSPLGKCLVLGPDPRDVYDGFENVPEKTAFPSFWGHDASKVTTMANEPNSYLAPLPKPRKGRKLRKVEVLWPRAGRLLIAQRPRLNTKRVSAIRLDTPVLCDVWWPGTVKSCSEEDEKILALWLNSTLGALLLWSSREDTEGAWVQFKKPVLTAMPVIDVSVLTEQQRQGLVSEYDRLCGESLSPFPNMAGDMVRKAIDSAIADSFHLPDLSVLRELLGQEPFVCLKPL